MTKRWLITDKGDPNARALVDGDFLIVGLPHYSRQTIGARQFTRNGQNLVFVTEDCLAVWVTFRPTPGKAKRSDGRDAWECALFRNEGPALSSDLIREACSLSLSLWGPYPKDGMITFIKPSAIRSPNPGYCYKAAGWVKDRPASDGKLCLRAPAEVPTEHWSTWRFAGRRGGLLRKHLEDK